MKSTKGVVASTGFTSKNMLPGAQMVKINSIELQDVPWNTKEPSKFLVLGLETEPVPGNFEGFNVDFEDPSKGKYLGQTATVKTSSFPYKDGVDFFKNNVTIEESVVKFVKQVEAALGMDWADNLEGIEDMSLKTFVKAFGKEVKGKFFALIIGGTQDTNDQGYPKYYLNIAQPKQRSVIGATLEDIGEYNKELDLRIKDAPVSVAAFDPESAEGDDPFSGLDDEDEL